MQFILSEEFIDYMVHLNHATMLLNPELGVRKYKPVKGLNRIKKVFKDLQCEKILLDSSLDE